MISSDNICEKSRNAGRSPAFEDISASIDLLRFPLIILIVFIHARFQGPDYPDSFTESFCKSVFFGIMPHCAVVAFFVISGYLFASKAEQRRSVETDRKEKFFSLYWRMLRSKSKSLLIPYLLWNTLVMLPHFLISVCGVSSPLLPDSKYAGMNFYQVLVRSYGLDMRVYPIDVPLWFVRSLMFFFLVSPAILLLIRHLPKYVSFCLLLAGSVLTDDKAFLFFVFGIFFGCFDIDLRPLKKILFLCLLPLPVFCLLCECFPSININLGSRVFLSLLNWFFLLFFFALAAGMKCLPENIRKWIVQAGGYSFWIFCSHAFVATTITRIGLRVRCLGMSPPLWIVLDCIVTIAITLAAFFVMRRVVPRMTRLLCGGRLPGKAA